MLIGCQPNSAPDNLPAEGNAMYYWRTSLRFDSTERAFMRAIGADCHDAVAAYSELDGSDIKLRVMKYVGGKCVYFSGTAPADSGIGLAQSLGDKMLDAEAEEGGSNE